MPTTRRGVTLVEVIVVLAIAATLVALLVPAFTADYGKAPAASREPPRTVRLWTAQHDGHWWVMSQEHFSHHPDCPCKSRQAESGE